jgi:4'-phosphopantetheinyl transferase
MVAAEGWPAFVDMHADVFCPAEASFLKYAILGARTRPDREEMGSTPEELLDYKLRCFYTLWCLREAYVKMTGDALVAPWLRELEFRNFRPPPRLGLLTAATTGGLGAGGAATAAAAVTEHEIWLRGRRVEDANVCLRPLGPDYMVCTALRTPGRVEAGLRMELGPFELVTVDEIVEFSESQP